MSASIRKASAYYVILISGAAALGGFLFGFDTAVINGAILALAKTFQASSWLTGFAVSLALLGSAVGAFCAGQIADRYGRVKAMVVASVLFTLSALGSGFAFSIWDFFFGGYWVALLLVLPALLRPLTLQNVRPLR